MKLEALYFTTLLEYFNYTISFQSKKVIYYSNHTNQYLIYKNTFGTLSCYSVSLSKNITINELLSIEIKEIISFDYLNHLIEKLNVLNSEPHHEQFALELETVKLPTVLNYLIQLKKLSKTQKQKYKNSFLINDLKTHDDNYLKLKLTHIEDVYEGNPKRPFYDYLIFNEDDYYTLFNKDQAVYQSKISDTTSTDVLSVFFDACSMLTYSLNNRRYNDVYLDLQPNLNFPYLMDECVLYERITINYNSQILKSLKQTLLFIVSYVSYKSDDIIQIIDNNNSSIFLNLYLRSAQLIPGSFSLKVSKGAQVQKLIKQPTMDSLIKEKNIDTELYNDFINTLSGLVKVKEKKYYVAINPSQAEDDTTIKLKHNFNTILEFPNIPTVLNDLILTLTNYYPTLNVFEFNDLSN